MTALDDAWGHALDDREGQARLGLDRDERPVCRRTPSHRAQRAAPRRVLPGPSFGWLRARTRGVGAPVLFHALCNVLASTLTRGYGLGG